MCENDAKTRAMQVSLAEVIDEYLVLERERDQLRVQCDSALNASRSLTQVAHSATQYTALLEAAVVACMPGLERGASTPTSSTEAALFVGELASQMEQIEIHVNELSASIHTAKKMVESISCSPVGDSLNEHRTSPSDVAGCLTPYTADAIHLRREARLRATEMTVASLNGELREWQQRYAQLRDRTDRERATAQQERDAEVRTLRTRLDESDAVLGRLSHELEALIDENARLKQQLRRMSPS